MPMKEEVEWVKSSMISCEVSLLAIVFSLAKALACPAARQMTIFLLILLLLSLGRSSFCNWAKEELMFRSPMTFSTSVGEPLTKVLRVVLTPSGAGKSFLKQHWRILPTQGVTKTRTARAMAGKKRMIVEKKLRDAVS